MKLEEIKEPIGKLITDSGLGEMTQDGLYLHYTDVITMMRTYAESQLKEVKEENIHLSNYAVHTEFCKWRFNGNENCDCGLINKLKQ